MSFTKLNPLFQNIMTIALDEATPPAPPAPTGICWSCGLSGVVRQTRHDNTNGNADRPYYKCLHCGLFLASAIDAASAPRTRSAGAESPAGDK
ncbi:uncharacterized protein N7482_003663 [Penicillium canariense]|uniref:GRF-like zinc ribbon domain-containing protein n=1 Tax=Penicillium canariense TaxID=189055 RepID=A0A9W9LNN0_9EURO|nr:uncharacterized protein N7482_003663 [Penicillium canariense]KAJ5168069.1 hypothetical protein N7482_003663 [Penicillium canariense]